MWPKHFSKACAVPSLNYFSSHDALSCLSPRFRDQGELSWYLQDVGFTRPSFLSPLAALKRGNKKAQPRLHILTPSHPHSTLSCSKYDPTSKDAMTFKHYNAKQVVMGRVSAPSPSASS